MEPLQLTLLSTTLKLWMLILRKNSGGEAAKTIDMVPNLFLSPLLLDLRPRLLHRGWNSNCPHF